MTFREERVAKEDVEDHKATLYYGLQKEMREIFEEFSREPKPQSTIFDYGRKLMALEIAYEKEGLNWEEIQEIRKGIRKGIKGE